MKKILSSLALAPAIAFAHGNHQETHSDVMHSVLHAMMSIEGLVIMAALGVAVYFLFKKQD
jgi:hydrogenase/urease accessory protein HupE